MRSEYQCRGSLVSEPEDRLGLGGVNNVYGNFRSYISIIDRLCDALYLSTLYEHTARF